MTDGRKYKIALLQSILIVLGAISLSMFVPDNMWCESSTLTWVILLVPAILFCFMSFSDLPVLRFLFLGASTGGIITLCLMIWHLLIFSVLFGSTELSVIIGMCFGIVVIGCFFLWNSGLRMPSDASGEFDAGRGWGDSGYLAAQNGKANSGRIAYILFRIPSLAFVWGTCFYLFMSGMASQYSSNQGFRPGYDVSNLECWAEQVPYLVVSVGYGLALLGKSKYNQVIALSSSIWASANCLLFVMVGFPIANGSFMRAPIRGNGNLSLSPPSVSNVISYSILGGGALVTICCSMYAMRKTLIRLQLLKDYESRNYRTDICEANIVGWDVLCKNGDSGSARAPGPVGGDKMEGAGNGQADQKR